MEGDRLTVVTRLTDALHDGYLSQQGISLFCGEPLAPFFAEQVITVLRQLSRCEPGHVLHQSQDGYIHLVAGEHADSLAGVGQCHLLWSAHDHRSGDGKGLYQCEVNVTGAGRQVDQEIVQFTPRGITYQLLERIAGHGTAPDNRIFFFHEEANGEHLHPILLDGLDHVTTFYLFQHGRSIFHTQHFRY